MHFDCIRQISKSKSQWKFNIYILLIARAWFCNILMQLTCTNNLEVNRGKQTLFILKVYCLTKLKHPLHQCLKPVHAKMPGFMHISWHNKSNLKVSYYSIWNLWSHHICDGFHAQTRCTIIVCCLSYKTKKSLPHDTQTASIWMQLNSLQ